MHRSFLFSFKKGIYFACVCVCLHADVKGMKGMCAVPKLEPVERAPNVQPSWVRAGHWAARGSSITAGSTSSTHISEMKGPPANVGIAIRSRC